MASTYTPIATTTLGSAQASYSFTSIPSTYTDLVLVFNGGSTGAAVNAVVQFNGDTGSNYSHRQVSGDGTTASSHGATNTTSIYLNYDGYMTNALSTVDIAHIQNYSNTTTYKTLLARANNSAQGTGASVGLWRSTAAINRVDVIAPGSTFLAGSTFTLYGILAA
jgi:hypothetical protein